MQDLTGKVDATSGADGSLGADQWNQFPTEVQNIITALGQALSAFDLNQLGKGIAGYVAHGDFYTDVGSENSYTLSTIDGKQSPPSYSDGMKARFIASTENSGASTVNVSGLGVVNILKEDGSALTTGDLSESVINKITYIGGNFILESRSSDSGGGDPLDFGTVTGAEILGDDVHNGWAVKLRLKNWLINGDYDLSPDAAKNIRLQVISDGFDSTPMLTKKVREVFGTVIVRKPYPDEDTANEVQLGSDASVIVSLNQPIYQGESVVVISSSGWATDTNGGGEDSEGGHIAAVNNSALICQKPIAKWAQPPFQKLPQIAELEIVAAHGHAQQGRSVAAVEFILSGADSGLVTSQVVTQTSVSQFRDDACAIEVYKSSIDTSVFTQGEVITARFIAYPFIGGNAAKLDTNDYEPDHLKRPANHPTLCDKLGTYTGAYAYVDPVSGDNSTGVVSSDPATALASPYLTIQGAASDIQAFNNTNHSRNNLSGGEIRLMAGTHNELGASMGALNSGDTWLVITRDPAALKADVRYGGSATNPTICDLVRFYDITFEIEVGNPTVIDGVDVSGAETHLWLDDINLTAQGVNPTFFRVGFRYITGGTWSNYGDSLKAFGANYENLVLLRGATLDGSGTKIAHCAIGSSDQNAQFSEPATALVNQIYPDGGFIGYNKSENLDGRFLTVGSRDENTIGRAVVGNLAECIGVVQPLFSASADSNIFPFNGLIVMGNTFVGSRTNMLYNDLGSDSILKTLHFSSGNIFMEWNNKRDTFLPENSGRTGNWFVSHKCGAQGDLYLQLPSDGSLAPSPDSWLGEYIGDGTEVNSSVNFVSDKSTNDDGDGLGGGDYHITSGSAAIGKIPPSMAFASFDLDGLPRLNNGNGSAGAYEAS